MSKIRVDQLSDVADTKTINVVDIAQVGDLIAGNIVSTPVGTITSTNVQGALSQVNTQLAAKQPLDATLTGLAGQTTVANGLTYSTGVDTFAQTTLTPFARTLLDDADAASMRTTLGVFADPGLGNGQTYQDLTGSRAVATTYTNSTGRTIFVHTSFQGGTASGVRLDVLINGTIFMTGAGSGSGYGPNHEFLVPAGATYRINITLGTSTLIKWSELR